MGIDRERTTNSLKIALFVGTVLNLINQGDVLWGAGTLSVPHVIMNYAVPFCVAWYSAWKNSRASGSPHEPTP
ncbi:hypothetical protein [Saccharospirillum impatiens]|uniref:hypothetical protein n=1 Tax=Saccharospirillum impatiens TaxID=169438 RepID=UPI0004004B22|nr:hypothetical protein [Saccharospirillum impatiens]